MSFSRQNMGYRLIKPFFTAGFLLVVMIVGLSSPVFSQGLIFKQVIPFGNRSFLHITGITQDKIGTMWFATKRGLFNYDGNEMISFTHNPLDSSSIVSNLLQSITIDSSGFIWIGTQGAGLDRLDPVSGNFRHYEFKDNDPGSISNDWVNVVFTDTKGILWVGTGEGLDRYNAETDSFSHYRNIPGDSTSLSYNLIYGIYEDKEGTLWIGTGSVYVTDETGVNGGLNRMDRSTGTFTRYMHDPDDNSSLINNKVRAIFEDSRGTFWVGTAGDGLHTMDRKSGKFTRHQHDPANPEKLARPPLNTDFFNNDHIAFITEDAMGNIWIGTTESGLNVFNPVTSKLTHYESESGREDAFSGRSTWCAYSSKEGVLWIGTMHGQLFRVNPQLNSLITHTETNTGSVSGFYRDPEDILWLGTDYGLIRQDIKSGSVVNDEIAEKLSFLNDIYVSEIKEDGSGNILIAYGEGLLIINKTGEIISKIGSGPGNSQLTNRTVAIIVPGRDDDIWAGTVMGLNHIDRKTGIVKKYLIFDDDTAYFGRNGIASLISDHEGRLWTGSWARGGVHRLNEQTGEFVNYLSGYTVNCLFEDHNGRIWAGCEEGLFFYDRHNESSFVRFENPNPFLEFSVILSITEDENNFLWIGTTSGIFALNPQRDQALIFGNYCGIGENVLYYKSCYKDPQGKLYFGAFGGYFKIDPSILVNNLKPPLVSIKDFSSADQLDRTGNKNQVNNKVQYDDEIRISYHQNVFSFDFSVIDYYSPESNNLIFMLEKYDENWRLAGSDQKAYFFNVPPGNYTFRVRGANALGIWAEKKVDLVIMAPWWRTWWAYTLYGLLLVSGIFGVDRVQRKRVIIKERTLIKEKELAQAREIEKAYHKLQTTQAQLVHAEKMASLGELTAGIAHEIQNPLNFVNNFSEVSADLMEELKNELKKGNSEEVTVLAEDIRQNLEKISLHGQRASGIVKGMLEHSRAVSGRKELADINQLAEEYLRLAYHGFRAKDKSFSAVYNTVLDRGIPKISVVPQEIGRVLLNIIGNAFYAVNLKSKQVQNGFSPTVSVCTLYNDKCIEIRIKDNGDGIPEDIRDKIFQPFYTTKPAGEGTGLGLSLSYDIITKGHQGEMKVETKEGEGTEFIIVLPG